jgi:hypothetical protein
MTAPDTICCCLRAVKSCQRWLELVCRSRCPICVVVFGGGRACDIAGDIQIPDSEHFPDLLSVVLFGLLHSPITCMKFLRGSDRFAMPARAVGYRPMRTMVPLKNNGGLRR